ARLGPEDALLQYYVVDGRLHAFLLSIPSSPHPGENVYQVHNLAPAAWLRDTLAAWQAYLENSYLHQHAPQASLTIAQGRLAQFHQALMSPLEKHLAGRQRLFLVLPPEFHPLPVAAFFDGRRYLAERFELVYLSSAAMLMEDEGLPSSVVRSSSSALSPALVVGHSNQGQLPAALLEAQQVGRTLHTQGRAVQLLLEDEARLDQVRQASRACDLLHLASHATFRPDNPFFSWVRLADARLTVADLYEMTLPQRPLVVLSACETGRGRPRGGGLLGMGRGFLAAGAAGVVVSQWKVGDAASAGFMGDFYHSLAGAKGMERDVAHALNQAQRLALSRQPHPYYWAGYIYLRG
ncbi:MAG: CHAT domain-containing protein, partial [Chloroflexota bacterium]